MKIENKRIHTTNYRTGDLFYLHLDEPVEKKDMWSAYAICRCLATRGRIYGDFFTP